MSKENYINVRNMMHTYSRAPLAEGQQHIDQLIAKAGHNVSINEIRGEDIPKITSINDRDMNYLVYDNDNNRIIGGIEGSKYVNILKFIENGRLQEIPNTNGESFIVVDKNGNAIVDWIDPVDAPLDQYSMSNGYEIRMFSENGSEIFKDYGWNFDAFNGIIHFNSNFNPSIWSFGNATIQGIVYIGKKVSAVVSEIDQKIDTFKNTVDENIAKSMAIQPFKFTTEQMTMIDHPYRKGDEFMQRLTFIVPGYCFEISHFINTEFTKTETFVTEMSHLADGCTQIFIDLPWYVPNNKPLLGYEYREENGISFKQPIIGIVGFVATTFMSQDGTKIPVKPTIDYSEYFEYIIPIPEDDAHEFVAPDVQPIPPADYDPTDGDGITF